MIFRVLIIVASLMLALSLGLVHLGTTGFHKIEAGNVTIGIGYIETSIYWAHSLQYSIATSLVTFLAGVPSAIFLCTVIAYYLFRKKTSRGFALVERAEGG